MCLGGFSVSAYAQLQLSTVLDRELSITTSAALHADKSQEVGQTF